MDTMSMDFDEEDEMMLQQVQDTVQQHNRRMSTDQRETFKQSLAKAKTEQQLVVAKQKKRRNSIQYYSEIQAQLQNGVSKLSPERRASMRPSMMEGLMKPVESVDEKNTNNDADKSSSSSTRHTTATTSA